MSCLWWNCIQRAEVEFCPCMKLCRTMWHRNVSERVKRTWRTFFKFSMLEKSFHMNRSDLIVLFMTISGCRGPWLTSTLVSPPATCRRWTRGSPPPPTSWTPSEVKYFLVFKVQRFSCEFLRLHFDLNDKEEVFIFQSFHQKNESFEFNFDKFRPNLGSKIYFPYFCPLPSLACTHKDVLDVEINSDAQPAWDMTAMSQFIWSDPS